MKKGVIIYFDPGLLVHNPDIVATCAGSGMELRLVGDYILDSITAKRIVHEHPTRRYRECVHAQHIRQNESIRPGG